MIRAWTLLLDETCSRIISARPFIFVWEAGALALVWKETLGYGDRVRVLCTEGWS